MVGCSRFQGNKVCPAAPAVLQEGLEKAHGALGQAGGAEQRRMCCNGEARTGST